MKSTKELFDIYTTYFANNNKKLKVERNGKLKIIDQKTWEVEVYSSWEDLDKAYGLENSDGTTNLTPVEEIKEEQPKPKCRAKVKSKTIPQFKYWVFGDPNRYEELREFMEAKYIEVCDEDLSFEVEFKKKDWVYYLDSTGNLCQTNNNMVIDLLKNSSDWTQLVLPIKKFTMEDIAKLVGLPTDQFEIV